MTGERFIANCFKPRKSVIIRRPRSPQRGADTKVSGTSIAYELPFRKSFDVSLEMIIAECQMTYTGAPWGRSKNIASLPFVLRYSCRLLGDSRHLASELPQSESKSATALSNPHSPRQLALPRRQPVARRHSLSPPSPRGSHDSSAWSRSGLLSRGR